MELTLKDFEQMEKIDHQYFQDGNIVSAKESYNWYLKDKNSCVALKENNVVVAYVNILSLKADVYHKIKNNLMNESNTKVEDLELSKEKYYNYLYFPVIAIDKDHRTVKTLKQLLNATTAHIKTILRKNKCKIIEVMTDCSTPQGEKITQRLLKLKPYKKTSHGSTIHILDGKTFLKQLA